MNQDQQELTKFGQQADFWWDPQGPFRTLHQINPLRLAYIEQQTQGLAGLDIIDIGCGGGLVAEAMAQRQANSVLGIDLAPESLEVARLHALSEGVTRLSYQLISAEDLAAQQPNSVDVVTCLEMLEHVPQPQSIVQAVADLLKPGGVAVFSTINHSRKAHLQMIMLAEDVLRWVPKGTHDSTKFIRPSQLMRYCENAGLTLRECRGLSYLPIKGFYLSRDVSVNYFVVAQKAPV